MPGVPDDELEVLLFALTLRLVGSFVRCGTIFQSVRKVPWTFPDLKRALEIRIAHGWRSLEIELGSFEKERKLLVLSTGFLSFHEVVSSLSDISGCN
jgi:hypothetical protein